MKLIDEAILLKKINYSESSVILTFFTKRSGIKKFILKGAKKRKQVIVPFGSYELSFVDKSIDSLSIISTMQWNGSKDCWPSPKKSLTAFFCADFLNSALIGSETDPDFFREILRLSNINNHYATQVQIIPLALISKTILHLGYCPIIDNKFKPYFDLKSGELSENDSGSSVRLLPLDFEILRTFFHEDVFFMSEDFTYTVESLRRVFKILIDYSNIHIPKIDVDKTLEIIQEVLYD